MPAIDREKAATRAILLNWVRLSEGDVSILHATMRAQGSCAGTIEGSANFVLWENLERLGWAERVRPAVMQTSASKRPAFFSLTGEGYDRLPAFIAHYDLKPGTYYIDKERPPVDPAALDRALENAANIILEERQLPLGLTFEARMKLRFIGARSVALALASFAYDAKESVAAALEFHKEGRVDQSGRELLALRMRIGMNLALTSANLPPPGIGLHDLASPLGVGLGSELETWLSDPTPSFPRATAWLAQHGPDIERFCELVRVRTSLPFAWE